MKILVIGSGSLARALIFECLRRPPLTVHAIRGYVAATDMPVLNAALDECDVVINAHGANPKRGARAADYLDQSVVTAHRVGALAQIHRKPSITVSTDCVLGKHGGETDGGIPGAPPTPDDLYGYAMALREGLVRETGGTAIRTSFVTPREGIWLDVSTVAAFAGWSNAYWSGSDVSSVAAKFLDIAIHDPPAGEVLNVATAAPITKLQIARHLVEALGYPCKVTANGYYEIDRSLMPSPGCEVAHFLELPGSWLQTVYQQQTAPPTELVGDAWRKVWRYSDAPEEHRDHARA